MALSEEDKAEIKAIQADGFFEGMKKWSAHLAEEEAKAAAAQDEQNKNTDKNPKKGNDNDGGFSIRGFFLGER